MQARLLSFIGAFTILVAVGCGSQARLPAPKQAEVRLPDLKAPAALSGDGVASLVKLMDRYKAMKSFQATVSWEFVTNGDTAKKAESERLIMIETPNRYRVVAVTGTMEFNSVSDGSISLEYAGSNGKLTEAGRTIADAQAENIRDPQINGSILFQLFRGGAEVGRLVESADPVIIVPQDDPAFQVIRFTARGRYGTTELKVDQKTGLVVQTQSQFEPFVKETERLPEADRLRSILVTEKFSNVKVDERIAATAFSVKPPTGMRVKDETKPVDVADQSLVAEGTLAPDFELTSLNGKSVKLSSLRGQTVLLDFWATWCLPCRKALPVTKAIHEKYGGKGLAVWTIPEEDQATVNVFLQQEGLKGLPVLIDPGKKTHQKYQIQGLPTYFVVDAEGKIKRIFLGEPDTRELLEALRDAGLPI